MVGESLFCNASGCNLHDFPINAYGVCVYLDHTRREERWLEARIEAQAFNANNSHRFSPDDVISGLGAMLTEILERVREQSPAPRPPHEPRRNQNNSGGGVPL